MSFLSTLSALVGRAAAALLPSAALPYLAPAPTLTPCHPDPQDARGAALDALRDYLAGIDIVYPNGRTGQLASDDIYVSASDDQGGQSALHLPALGIAGGQADDELIQVGPPEIDDDTWGIAGPGTALAWIGEHRERATLEIWATDDDERRAVMRALRRAFRPADGMGTLVLPLPKYWNQIARYQLGGMQVIDDADAARNRVRALLFVDFEVAVVELIGAVKMRPRVRLETETAED